MFQLSVHTSDVDAHKKGNNMSREMTKEKVKQYFLEQVKMLADADEGEYWREKVDTRTKQVNNRKAETYPDARFKDLLVKRAEAELEFAKLGVELHEYCKSRLESDTKK